MEDLFGAAQAQQFVGNQGVVNQQNVNYNQGASYPQNYNQGVSYPQGYNQGMDYNQGQYPMGTCDNYGNIKFSKAEYLDGLRNYVMQSCNYQVAISREEKLEDIPAKLRHCCIESPSKISMLDRLSFDVPVTNMHIPFYFCKDCGKLFYYKDFML